MSNPKTRKSCVVPKCFNTTTNAPEKLFFLVPYEPKTRKKWMQIMKRVDPPGAKSTVYCCEDHFDIENDMENFVKHKLVGGPLKLKKGVIPHKFAWQKSHVEKPERSAVAKRRKIAIINKILNEPLPCTSTDVEEIFIVDPTSTAEQALTEEKEADPFHSIETNIPEPIIGKKCSKKVQVCIKTKTHDKGTMTDENYFKGTLVIRKRNTKKSTGKRNSQ